MPPLLSQLVACHECGLLLEEVPLRPGGEAVCCCCGASLYRNVPYSLQRTLALTVAAIILFIIANAYPILGIEMQGQSNSKNLFGAIHSLWDQKMHMISVIVFINTILVPSIELSILLYVLIPVNLGFLPPGIAVIMRVISTIKPWGMVEVFMLGILISVVKLKSDALVIPGIALWSFGALTLILTAIAASFNPRDVWEYLDSHDSSDGDL